LKLLNLHEPIPLVRKKVINLLMEVSNFQFRLEVHLIVMLRTNSVICFLTILTHRDDWCLDGGKAGKQQIKEYKRVWIKRTQ
jgi:hypothetical protein